MCLDAKGRRNRTQKILLNIGQASPPLDRLLHHRRSGMEDFGQNHVGCLKHQDLLVVPPGLNGPGLSLPGLSHEYASKVSRRPKQPLCHSANGRSCDAEEESFSCPWISSRFHCFSGYMVISRRIDDPVHRARHVGRTRVRLNYDKA